MYPAFILQLALLFSNNASCYTYDNYKIRAARSYFLGSALSWFHPNCDKTTGAVNWFTYTEFVESLKAAYNDSDKRAMAEHKLMNLSHGNKTASAYYSEFTIHAAILSLDNTMKISFFKRRVNDKLSITLSYQLDPATNLALFVGMCITLDYQARMGKNRLANQPVTTRKPACLPAHESNPAPANKAALTSNICKPCVAASTVSGGGNPLDRSKVSRC